MFTHRPSLASLFFFALIVLGINYVARSDTRKESGQQTRLPPIYGDTAAKHLPHSLHVIVPHGGQGFGGLNGIDCIDNLITSFVEKGSSVGLDTSCVSSITRQGLC